MRRDSTLVVVATLIAVLGWSGGCRSSPRPEVLFTEAEILRGKYEKEASHRAIAKYREAIAEWERQGQKRDAAKAWQRVGDTNWQLGSLYESLRAYEAALSLAQGSADPLFESAIRSDVGIAQSYAAANPDALAQARQQCEQALALSNPPGGDRERGKALNCLGEVAYFRQDSERALEFHREAGRVFVALGDEVGQAQTLLNQGHVYSDLGRFEEARSTLNRAEALWARLQDKREQAIARVAKGRLEVRLGNYQAGLNQFQQALTSLEPIGDSIWEGSSLTGIALVFLHLGETDPAVKHWERALHLFESAGLKIFAVDVLMSLGATYLASGNDTVALSRFERALALAGELGIERWKAYALRSIGVVQLVRHRPDDARKYFALSSESQRTVRDPELERKLRADLGETIGLQGQHEVAIEYFEEALALSQAATDRVTEARALFGLARASLGANRLDQARTYIDRAVSAAESLRTAVESRDLRASYVASVYGYYELQVGILARLNTLRPTAGFSARAFEASERARARSLLESLTESGVDLRAGLNPALLEREQAAKLAFDHWAQRSRLSGEEATRNGDSQRLAREYRDLEERYSQIQAEIRSQSPRYAALARPQPLSLRAIQNEVLDRDTVLLEYALGDERSYVWIV